MWNKKDKIVVLLGGPSTEAEVSRRTGNAIASALDVAGYEVETLEFSPKEIMADLSALQPKVVFNALHGKYGEDGMVQSVLEMLEIPYTGSGKLSSAITMDKVISKRLFAEGNIPTAPFRSYMNTESFENIYNDILSNFTFPLVVKAPNQGSTIGITIVRAEAELKKAIEDAFRYDVWVLVESFVFGRELTATVLNGKALPIIEIVPHSGVYDYQSKYTSGATDYLVPAPIDEQTTIEVQRIAEQVYALMGNAGVARVDFILDEKNIPYVLEVNTVPGMTETSLVPKSAKASGLDFVQLCEAILETAGIGKL